MTEIASVAVLGTGRMGSAMVRSLARSGRGLILWNRTRDRAESLARELAADVAATPAEAAAGADLCLTMLADDDAVTEVYAGRGGLLEGVRAGAVLVDSSTVTPSTIRRFEPRARLRGAGLLDAPVSGSVSLAESGQLTMMVGGSADDLERARPVLGVLARTIFHVGALGAGAAMKLAVNTLVFGLNEAIAEGLVLAEAAGVERSVAYDVFAASAVRSPFIDYKRPAFLDPAATPPAFALELAAKDLRLITGLGAQLGVGMPQAAANLASIRAAIASLDGERDFAEVATRLREARAVDAGTSSGAGPP